MEVRRYSTIINGERYECKACSKSEARGEFKKIVARMQRKMAGPNVFILPHSLGSKVRLIKEKE